MKTFYIYRRPYNIGMGWKFWRETKANSPEEALKQEEFKNERVWIDEFNNTRAIMGGITEFWASDVEIENPLYHK